MNARYLFGSLITIPLLPLMYVQGKQIRARVPKLPEASGLTGSAGFSLDGKRPLRLVALGESTVAGVGVETHEEGFTGSLARALSAGLKAKVEWKVVARSGYTAKRVREKLVSKIEDDAVDLIVIGLGGNDAFTLNRPSAWRRDVRALIRDLRVRYPESVIVFCNMPPIKIFPAFTPLIKFTIGNLVEILGDELAKEVQSEPRVYYFGERITLEAWMDKFQLDTSPASFFSDGVHPSKLTYETWGRDIAQNILSSEAIRKELA